MQFGGGDIGCWGVYWSVKYEFISSHRESYSVHLFLQGPNVADDAAICDLGVLGDFVPVDEKTSVSSLYVPNSLEKLSNLNWNSLDPFEFVRSLDNVPVLLGLSYFGEDDCVSSTWFESNLDVYLVDDCLFLSLWSHEEYWLTRCGVLRIDGCHMFCHEVLSLEMTLYVGGMGSV